MVDTVSEREWQAFSVRLPVELHKRAKIKSIETGRTLGEVIVEKMAEWVAEAQPAPREKKVSK